MPCSSFGDDCGDDHDENEDEDAEADDVLYLPQTSTVRLPGCSASI